MRKLRILVTNWRDMEHPNAGGAERYLYEIARRWIRDGHQVQWWTAGFSGSQKHADHEGISIKRFGNRFTVYPLIALALLRQHEAFDFILDSENGVPFFSAIFAPRTARLLIIYHVHRSVFLRYLPFPISWLFVFIETVAMPAIYGRRDIVTISESSRQDIFRYKMSDHDVPVISCGIDENLLPSQPKALEPTLLYLGRLMPYKRVDKLIEIFRRIRQSFPRAVLVIAGTGPEESRLRQIAEQSGVIDFVRFEGYVDEKRKRDLLSASWVFVMASSMEGFGMAIIEANACGTTVVALDAPGVREAILHGKTGLLASNLETFEKHVSSILCDANLRVALERAAFENSKNYRWDRSAQAIKELGVAAEGRMKGLSPCL